MEPHIARSPIPPPPPPPSSIPASPSLGPRKRSLSELDTPAMSHSSPKRALTERPSEKENRDPSVLTAEKNNLSPQSTQKVSVEIPFKVYTQNTMSDPAQSSVFQTATGPSHAQQTGAGSVITHDGSMAPTPKKRKLSPASQQARQQEKEAKERLKNEERQRKEEEKRKREEEKRLKEEEKKRREAEREEDKRQRDEKKKVKEEEKAAKEAAKEEEKKRKEEEKLKKERAQPKLNSFFAKPKLPSPAPGIGISSPTKAVANTAAPIEAPVSSQSDYNKAFPEFFLQSHTTLAPSHRFQRDSAALQHVRQTIDRSLASTEAASYHHRPFRASEVFHIIPFTRRRGRHPRPVKEILRRIQTAADAATQPGVKIETDSQNDPRRLLQKITMKSLKFGEDVRPPYQGTFTREVPAPSAKKLCRNPYYRGLPDVNYDYDSEAEWEEPEEGEDLDSEEEEESDEGEDDMDGFLDDEDDALAGGKRRLIVGDLDPVCSGLRWASEENIDAEFQAYRIQPISDAVEFPIDPFSTKYWQKPRAETVSVKGRPTTNHTLDGYRVKPSSDAPPPMATKAKRPFPSELLTEFKQAVEGSDLSKIGLVEILKKKFPKVSKDTLKITLDEVAMRVGQKEVDKQWVCR